VRRSAKPLRGLLNSLLKGQEITKAQLARARPVLERLNDRRSLRRLEEVEALLA